MYRQRLQAIAREAGFPVDEYGDAHFVVSHEVVGELRTLQYVDQWRSALANRWYHLRMQDHSLFLFSEGLSPSYSFIHCPLEIMTFPDYLAERGEENNPRIRREMAGSYQNVIDTAAERRHVTPIRYDYDPRGYQEGVHPVAHIHIGLGNEVRLCSNKMSAASFVLFVMRQMYPKSWEQLLTRKGLNRFVNSIREPSTRLEERYFGAVDRIELHLT